MKIAASVVRLFAIVAYVVVASTASVHGQRRPSPLPATTATPSIIPSSFSSSSSPSPSQTSPAPSTPSVNGLDVSAEYVTLYQTLEKAASKGQGNWKDIKVPTFKADEMTKVLTRLIIEITTTERASYLEKYTSFGMKLPRDLDLGGLIEANPANPPEQWQQVSKDTMKALSPEDDRYVDGRLLWEAMNSYYEVKKLDTTTTDPKKLNMAIYDGFVLSYFAASTELVWGTDLVFVDGINATEVVGKYRSKNWFNGLVSTDNREISYDASMLTELALLKHVDGEILTSSPGDEVGNSIVTNYFPSMNELLQNSAVAELQQLFAEENFAAYAEIASAYCQPNTLISFCLLPHIYEQTKLFGNVGRDALDADIESQLPEEAANLKRQQYLETIQDRLHSQSISIQIMTEFDNMIDHVHTYANDISLRVQQGAYEKAYNLLYSVRDQMDTEAQKAIDVADADRDGSQYAITINMKNLQIKIDTVFKTFPDYEAAVKRLVEHANAAEAAKVVNSIFSFFAKVLNALNPITWITNPTAVGDVFSAGNDLRKAITGSISLENLIDIINNNLFPWFKKMNEAIKEIQPQLTRVIESLKPLLAVESINVDAIKQHGAEFIKVYSQYHNPISKAEVFSVMEIFTSVTGELCRIAGGRATPECDFARTAGNIIFDNLRQSVELGEQSMDEFVELAQAIVRKKSAEQFQISVTATFNTAMNALNNLQEKWTKQSDEANTAYAVYLKRLTFGRSVATYRYLATTIQSNAAAVTACNFMGYLNGGVPVAPCEGVYSNVATPVDVNRLIAFQFNTKPAESKVLAYLPTVPSSPNDTAYLSLDRLMNGENVTFLLPMDQDWLVKHKWVTAAYDITNTVAYVKKLQIFLPPREAAGGGIRTIDLTIKASKWSPLGPAMNNKQYVIPQRTFPFRYQAFRDLDACANELMNPYTCGDERKFCELSSGEVDTDDETPLPSLFSLFEVSAKFSSKNSNAAKLEYTGVEKSLPLAIGVDLATYKVDGKNIATHAPDADADAGDVGSGSGSGSGARRLRATNMAAEVDTCCENNSYVTQWKASDQKPVCSACPEGHESQFGGLYCLPAPILK